MQLTNIHQAKTHLSRLIERAAAGEEIVIAKAGKPVARLVGYREQPPAPRKPGYWRGKVRISKDFDLLPEEIAAAFRGERP
ncbi:MAG: type II toxin-antitoxin system Phd/YefM family antitoxin [Acidobacteria bacterium]|nr:type II toxin-antitoxin system Phd/YefM family antitoxin [Acidobacteriota bacterium]